MGRRLRYVNENLLDVGGGGVREVLTLCGLDIGELWPEPEDVVATERFLRIHSCSRWSAVEVMVLVYALSGCFAMLGGLRNPESIFA